METPWSQTFKEKARRHKEEDREDPVRARFPSSTLLPFLLGVSLLKPNVGKKGTLFLKGLLGNQEGDAKLGGVACLGVSLEMLFGFGV